MKRICLLLLSLFIGIGFGYAQTGCLSSTNNLYRNYQNQRYGVPNYYFRTLNDRVEGASSIYCLRPLGGSNSCYITNTTAGYESMSSYGTLVSYGPLPCPIDDYAPLMILGLAGLGILTIKKKHLF